MLKYAFFYLTVFSFLTCSCGTLDGKKDSVEVAKEKNDEKANISEDETEFIVEAVSECLMEIELGKIAQQNGWSPKVKEFGITIVKDHSKVKEQLTELAARKNITIPATPGDKHQKLIKKLLALRGPKFDKEYIDAMIKCHERDLNKFKEEATNGKNPETKAFASGQLEVFQQHLHMAEAIRSIVDE